MPDDYLVASSEPFDALTTASYIRKKAPFELIIVINPLGAANIVYASISGTATTTPSAGAGSEPIAPGGAPGVYFLGPGNTSGISVIAATATVGLVLKRVPFPDIAAFFQAIGAYAASAALVSALWQYVAGSTTQIQTLGAIVEARADTVRPKTAATAMSIADSSDVSRINITASGNAIVRSADLADRFVVSNNLALVQMNNATTMGFTDATTQFRNMATTAVALFDGDATGERHRFNSTDRVRETTGDGAAGAQVTDAEDVVVEDGLVINANDIVELSTTNPRVRAAQTSSVLGLGFAIAGVTGNAAGTAKARVRSLGIMVGALLADDAGVTQFQYGAPGATDANQLLSKTTIEGTFCRILETAASGVAVDFRLHGSL